MNDQDKKPTQDEPNTPNLDSEGQEDNGGDVDWKAKYEEMKKHSRTWEQRAKDNLDELEKLREGDKSEADKIRERISQLEQANAEAKAENLRLSIGAEFGLSKADVDDFLHGTEEDMRRQAQRLAERAQVTHPENKLQGRGGQGSTKRSAENWAAKLLGKTETTT